MRMEQEAQLNAPDPRESRPPCYEDAILLPRLGGSFASLDELSTRRKMRKSKDDNEDEAAEPVPLTRRCRCRSEEVLSMRESVRPDPNSRRSKAIRNTIIQNQTSPRNSVAPPNPSHHNDDRAREEQIRNSERNSTHYHSTDILRMNNLNLQRTTSNPNPPLQIPIFTNQDGSPYSPRRSHAIPSPSNSIQQQPLPRIPDSPTISEDDSEEERRRKSPYSRRRISQKDISNGRPNNDNIYHSPVDVHVVPK